MNLQEERRCTHCNKVFYVREFKLTEAKTLSCYFCKKRFIAIETLNGKPIPQTNKKTNQMKNDE